MDTESSVFIGVMSGTSLDGVDIVLCEIDSSDCQLLLSSEYPFDKQLKSDILQIINETTTTIQEIGILNHRLGVLFGDAISSFMCENKIDAKSVRAIGLHGQTLWHQPDEPYPFSMQLGDANIVSAKTDVQVIADFRGMDIANGGQGAPFAPAFHQFIFKNHNKISAVLNIGGMANITLLDDEVKGFDSGCGNVLLDLWASIHISKSYDRDGEFAKSGEVHQELLVEMLHDEYFKKLPPKSTGREYFNQKWLAKYLMKFKSIKNEDIQRTLLELTAQTIADDVKKTKINQLIVCGGGAKNIFLMQRLEMLCGTEVVVSDELGVSGDFMEAMLFAWLAYKRVHRQKVALSGVTGAKKDSILGCIYG